MSSGPKENQNSKQDELWDRKTDNPSVAVSLDKVEELVGKGKKEDLLTELIGELKEVLKEREEEVRSVRSEKDRICSEYAEFREDAGQKITGLEKDVMYLEQRGRSSRILDLVASVCFTIGGALLGFWLSDKGNVYGVVAGLFLAVGVVTYAAPALVKKSGGSCRLRGIEK